MQIGIVYASDYDSLSPGGIRNYIVALGDSAPKSIFFTYFGIGRPEGQLNSRGDKFIPVGNLSSKPKRMKLNSFFALRLLSKKLPYFDALIFHRADNLVFTRTRRNVTKILILHGGTDNAKIVNKNKGLLSRFYKVIEIIARAKADQVFSVDPARTLPPTVNGKGVNPAPLVYDKKLFNLTGTSSNRKDFAILSRFSSEKRNSIIIEAFKKSGVEGTLHAIGDGPEMQNLNKLAGSANVIFHGFLKPEEISEMFKHKVGRLLSASDCEGFPLAFLEATACGCETIGLDAPGVTSALNYLGGKVVRDERDLQKSFQTPITLSDTDKISGLGRAPEEFWSTLRREIPSASDKFPTAKSNGTTMKK
jgi:glycosyltransferase involved in cell wall biosynthesis